MGAILEKSLSSVKTVAECSHATAAINAAIVVSVMLFARAIRKMAAASR